MSCRAIKKPETLPPTSFININDVRVDAEGRFFLTPLPIGVTYAVVACRGHNEQVGAPVQLEGSRATVPVEIRLARISADEGRVVGPDGRPLSGVPATLELEHPLAATSWVSPSTTDRDGRFRFDDLSSELGEYKVSLRLRQDYQPTEATLNPGGPPVEVHLGRGHVLEGRVIDAKTGWPIPGVEMFATPQEWQPMERNGFEAEATTDKEGRFRFSDLPDRAVQLNDRDGLQWQSPDKLSAFNPDRTGPIQIEATLPGWSKLKSVAPPGR